MIALDIDGTLVDHTERLSPRVLAAVLSVVDAGAHVVLATGRSLHGTLPVLRRLGLRHGWVVCSNGAVTLRLDPGLPRGFEVTRLVTFDPAEVLHLLREHLPQAVFAVEDVTFGHRVTARLPANEVGGTLLVVPFADLLQRPVARAVVRSDAHTAEQFWELIERVGLAPFGVGYSIGYTAWLDLAAEGVTKAAALELIRQELDVDHRRTLAVGDGSNDLEMFSWAARSVAMGQARPAVIAAAGEVTGTIADDGLAAVLESLAPLAVLESLGRAHAYPQGEAGS